MRDIAAIPALTSLLTSDPRSDIGVLRENHLTFQPLMLLEIDSVSERQQKKVINKF